MPMGSNFQTQLAQAVMVLVPMILSLTVHEFSHAIAAKRLGDDTAERMNRLPARVIVAPNPASSSRYRPIQ